MKYSLLLLLLLATGCTSAIDNRAAYTQFHHATQQTTDTLTNTCPTVLFPPACSMDITTTKTTEVSGRIIEQSNAKFSTGTDSSARSAGFWAGTASWIKEAASLLIGIGVGKAS